VGPRGDASSRDIIRIPLFAGETALAALERHFGHPVPRSFVEPIERRLAPGATLVELRPLSELFAADRGLEPERAAAALPGATYVVASPRLDWEALVREHYGAAGLTEPAVDGLVLALRAINQVGGRGPHSIVVLPDLATLDGYLKGMRRAAEVAGSGPGVTIAPRPGQDYTAFAGESPVDIALAAYAAAIAAAPSEQEAAALAERLTLGLVRANRGRDLDGDTLVLHVPTLDEALRLGAAGDDGERGDRLRAVLRRGCASALRDARAVLAGGGGINRLAALDAARAAVSQARVQRALERAGDDGMSMFGLGFMFELAREFHEAPPREPRAGEDPRRYLDEVFPGLTPDRRAAVLKALAAHDELLRFLDGLGEHAGTIDITCPPGTSTVDAIVADLERRNPRLPPGVARGIAETLGRYAFEIVGTRTTDRGVEEIRRFAPKVSFVSAADVVIHADEVATRTLSARHEGGGGRDAGWDAHLWREALRSPGTGEPAADEAERSASASGAVATADPRAATGQDRPGAAAEAARQQRKQVLADQRRTAERLAAITTGVKEELDDLAERNRVARSDEVRADPTDPRPVRRR
jgi:hypothetical protein